MRGLQGLCDHLPEFVRVPRRLQILEVEGLPQFVRAGVQGAPGAGDPGLGDGHPGRGVRVEDLAPVAVDLVHLVAVVERVRAGRELAEGVLTAPLGRAQVPQRLAEILGEGVRDVDPESVHAPVGPEPQGGAVVVADVLVPPVEVGLLGGEEVQVPLPVRHPLPGAAAEHGLPVGGRQLAPLAPAVPEDVAVAGGRTRTRAQRLLEPDVLVGGVVGDDVDDHLQPEPVRLADHRVEVVEGAQARIDVPRVGDVVAAVGELGGVERAQPQGVDAQRGEVGEAPGDAAQVPQSVTVGVGEAARVHLVDDGLPPPVGVPGGEVGRGVGHGVRGPGVGRGGAIGHAVSSGCVRVPAENLSTPP